MASGVGVTATAGPIGTKGDAVAGTRPNGRARYLGSTDVPRGPLGLEGPCLRTGVVSTTVFRRREGRPTRSSRGTYSPFTTDGVIAIALWCASREAKRSVGPPPVPIIVIWAEGRGSPPTAVGTSGARSRHRTGTIRRAPREVCSPCSRRTLYSATNEVGRSFS